MRQRRANWAWLLYTVFIVYGGTIPFHFAGDHAAIAEKLHQLPLSPWVSPDTGRRLSIPDLVQNVLFFVPFGVLGMLAGGVRTIRASRLALVTVLGGLLSLIVELFQLLEADRVASVADLMFNTIGAFAGATLALAGRGIAVATMPRLRAAGLASVPEFRPLAIWTVVLLVAAWQPFDVTIEVGTVARKVRALAADPWQFTGLRDEGLTFLVSALFSLSVAAYFKAIGHDKPARSAFLVCVASCAFLESIQILITSRMPGLWDGCVLGIGAAAGTMAWKARTRVGRAEIWNVAIIGATAVAVVLSLLSPFQISGTYQSFGWFPLYGYYARTTLQTLSHVIELLLLYFPLGFCLALRPGPGGPHWVPVALVALVIAAPVEYLQGWIVGRFPDASDIALSVAGAWLGASMAAQGFVQGPGNSLTKGGNSADKTEL